MEKPFGSLGIGGTDTYPWITACKTFNIKEGMHGRLVRGLEEEIKTKGQPKVMLLAGTGVHGSPIGDMGKPWLNDFLGGTNIVFVDQDSNALAKSYAYLVSKGLLEKHAPLFVAEDYWDLRDKICSLMGQENTNFLASSWWIGAKTMPDIGELLQGKGMPKMIFLQADLKKELPIAPNLVDVVDCSLTGHHMAVNRKRFQIFLEELQRILVPGGLLHYGDAETDFGASEYIIDRLTTMENIVLKDCRDPNNVVTWGQDGSDFVIELGEDGICHDLNGLRQVLEMIGIKVDQDGTFPLIDPGRWEVERKHQLSVNWHYGIEQIEKVSSERFLGAYDQECFNSLRVSMANSTYIEAANALKGLFEYFRPKSYIKEGQNKAGYCHAGLEIEKEWGERMIFVPPVVPPGYPSYEGRDIQSDEFENDFEAFTGCKKSISIFVRKPV